MTIEIKGGLGEKREMAHFGHPQKGVKKGVKTGSPRGAKWTPQKWCKKGCKNV